MALTVFSFAFLLAASWPSQTRLCASEISQECASGFSNNDGTCYETIIADDDDWGDSEKDDDDNDFEDDDDVGHFEDDDAYENYDDDDDLIGEVPYAADTIGGFDVDTFTGSVFKGGWKMYECEAIFSSDRPIHDEAAWLLMRAVYVGVVGPENSSIGRTASRGDGFSVKVRAEMAPGKGRGNLAAELIPATALVWSGDRSAAFTDGPSYRRFLASIPKDMACDVIQWAYVANLGKGGRPVICADLDGGSYMNSSWEDDVENNLGFNCERVKTMGLKGTCFHHLFALRDIEEGEEMLVNYGDFADPDGWSLFGM